jgi:hypothetical protein
MAFELSEREYGLVSEAMLDLLASRAYAYLERAQREEIKKIFHAFLTLQKNSIKST